MSGDDKNNEWVISYRQIGLIILVFILGLITALLISNAQTGSPSAFTTTELISFVLSVILSGSSIVLAVTAITLGKSSEQAVIKRSDESIRLQNEVFIKTTEALQRIEASTGVTEKRIEDIISGRVGDISQSIAELATGKRKGHSLNKRELEEEIRRSIMREVKEKKTPEEKEERERKRKEEGNRYHEFHQLTLSSFSNRDDTKAEKLGHGSTGGKGDKLFDGLFLIGESRIGLSAFHNEKLDNLSYIDEYIAEVAKALIGNTIKYAVLVFDNPNTNYETISNYITTELKLYKDNPIEHIKIVVDESENLSNALNDLTFSNNTINPDS